MNDEALKGLVGACARCGTCRTVCTIYPHRKDEIAVARGKLALIEASIGGRDGAPKALEKALADCLLCGRCERSCPNGVLVEEIVMRGRADLAEEIGIPAWKQVLFGKVLASPGAKAAARRAGSRAQRAFLKKIPTGSGLHYRFPDVAGQGGRTTPELPGRGFIESLGADEAVSGSVVLFAGCVFDHVFPQVGRAAYETMRASGLPVAVFRDAACCGLPAMVSGDFPSARRCASENVRRLAAAGHDRIVFPCGSCLLMFRRNALLLFPEGDPLRADALRVAERSVDYATFILDSGVAGRIPSALADPADAGTVAYHDPCHLSGTLGKGSEARALLEASVGGAFAETKGAPLCCGYGGTFNARDYGTSSAIGEGKIRSAAEGGAKVVSTACSGCVLQLRDMAARFAPGVRIVHIAELVSAALSRR